MPSKDLQELLIKRYEQFNFFTKFAKNRKFKSDFPQGKMLRNFFDGKGVSFPQKLRNFFKKIYSKNNDFNFKNLKNTKSPTMSSKHVQKPLIMSNEQFKNFSKLLFFRFMYYHVN